MSDMRAALEKSHLINEVGYGSASSSNKLLWQFLHIFFTQTIISIFSYLLLIFD